MRTEIPAGILVAGTEEAARFRLVQVDPGPRSCCSSKESLTAVSKG